MYGTLCDLDGQHVCGEFRLAFFAFPNPRCVSRAFLAGRQGGWSGRRGFRKLSLLRLVFFSHVSRSSGIGVTVDIL